MFFSWLWWKKNGKKKCALKCEIWSVSFFCCWIQDQVGHEFGVWTANHGGCEFLCFFRYFFSDIALSCRVHNEKINSSVTNTGWMPMILRDATRGQQINNIMRLDLLRATWHEDQKAGGTISWWWWKIDGEELKVKKGAKKLGGLDPQIEKKNILGVFCNGVKQAPLCTKPCVTSVSSWRVLVVSFEEFIVTRKVRENQHFSLMMHTWDAFKDNVK